MVLGYLCIWVGGRKSLSPLAREGQATTGDYLTASSHLLAYIIPLQKQSLRFISRQKTFIGWWVHSPSAFITETDGWTGHLSCRNYLSGGKRQRQKSLCLCVCFLITSSHSFLSVYKVNLNCSRRERKGRKNRIFSTLLTGDGWYEISHLILMDDTCSVCWKISNLPSKAPPSRLQEEREGSLLARPDIGFNCAWSKESLGFSIMLALNPRTHGQWLSLALNVK